MLHVIATERTEFGGPSGGWYSVSLVDEMSCTFCLEIAPPMLVLSARSARSQKRRCAGLRPEHKLPLGAQSLYLHIMVLEGCHDARASLLRKSLTVSDGRGLQGESAARSL